MGVQGEHNASTLLHNTLQQSVKVDLMMGFRAFAEGELSLTTTADAWAHICKAMAIECKRGEHAKQG